MKFSTLLFFLLVCFSVNIFSQNYKVVESTADHLMIEFNFGNGYRIKDTTVSGKTFQLIKGKSMPLRSAGEPWLPAFYVSASVPQGAGISLSILSDNMTT